MRPRNSGQGGLQQRWTPGDSDYEFGFYAANYHERVASALVLDFTSNSVYLDYAEDVHTCWRPISPRCWAMCIGAGTTSSLAPTR